MKKAELQAECDRLFGHNYGLQESVADLRSMVEALSDRLEKQVTCRCCQSNTSTLLIDASQLLHDTKPPKD